MMRKKVEAKGWFISLMTIIFVTDVVILLDIPILRQILSFLCFTTIPGLLILYTLKLDKISFLKKFVLSVGLSISFLMFVGLLINILLPSFGFSKPLSTLPLTLSFSVILLILSLISYHRNKDDLYLCRLFTFQVNKRTQFFSPLLFSLLFPPMSVIGTHLMNTRGDNVLLIVMLFLIPAYVVLLTYLNKKIPKVTYPIAIWMISMSLLLMRGLSSDYMMGVDVYTEHHAFRVVLTNFYWSISNYPNALTACLSASLLPTIYQSLLDINAFYIYKAIYPLVVSIIPVVCYILFRKYLGSLYAFLSSIFFMAQLSFQFSTLWEGIRVGTGILFFALAMMVFFDDEINKRNKKVLFLIFMSSVLVAYYAAVYIFFILIFLVWLMSKPLNGFLKSKSNISGNIVMLLFTMIFVWWSQITDTTFIWGVHFFRDTFINLSNLFVKELRHETTTYLYNVPTELLPQMINIIVHDITFIFLAIGVISLIINYKRTKFDIDYLRMMLIMLGLLVTMLVLPYVSQHYGSMKLYQISLVILAPAFVIGGKVIAKYIQQPRFDLLIILLVLTCQFICASCLVFQLCGYPFSPLLNSEGVGHDLWYIYNQEIVAAQWLIEHGGHGIMHMDTVSPSGTLKLGKKYDANQPQDISKNIHQDIRPYFFEHNESIEHGYIFLRHANVINGLVYNAGFFKKGVSIKDYSQLFVGKGKIYNNGVAEVHT